MSAGTTTPLKKPRDYFTWGYWLLFLLVIPTIAIWMANKPTQVSLPTLKQNLAAYSLISANDVSMQQVDITTVAGNTVRNQQDLVGHYTLTSVFAQQPVLTNQISPKPEQASLILNTLAAAIPATSATTLGGNLRAGELVSLAVVPLSSPTATPTIVFDQLLVLDIKSSGGQTVIILAILAAQWLNYLTKTHHAIIVLARQIN